MRIANHQVGALFIVLGTVVFACSDDASSTATSATSAGQGGSTTTTTGGGGSSASTCDLFDGTSCVGFLDGCWAPDLTGTCTDGGTELSWSDGHKIVRVGTGPGLYGPGDAMPCISLTFDGATNTSTLTNNSGDVLLNQDLGDGNILITCPDGDEHSYPAADLEADNLCKGVSCP